MSDQQLDAELEKELLLALEEDDHDTPAQPQRLSTLPSAGVLLQLSDMALLRVLCCLSAEDLCSLSCCSKYFKSITADPMLWNRLYKHRWTHQATQQDDEEDQEEAQPNWKKLYLQRDAAELIDVMEKTSDALQPLYLQMTRARRGESLGLENADAIFAAHISSTYRSTVGGRIADFRNKHGIIKSPEQKQCTQKQCKYVQLENVTYICTTCGSLHTCGDACREYIIEKGSDLPVCPISGRCFERMMTEAEENDRGDGGGNNADADWNAEDMGGRLGRAFFAGYHAVDEKEMLMKFGVKL